jgi:hypothetical protein
VIGKVLRGTNARRLLYYLYGPGKSNEHVDPHLVAGFSDPAELEPERRLDGSADLRRLSALLHQPLAALVGPEYDKPVWHCSVRNAPGDRILSDAEWAQVAAQVMDRTGLAPAGDDLGVRWVAVRHAADHVHIVATLARQDGVRPKVWNDFYRVREACLDAERQLGLVVTAPADRTAARRPARAETEQAARRGWAEAPRIRLRREVCAAAGGAGTEQEFFARLAESRVLIRRRYSVVDPAMVTGYAVGLPEHVANDGGPVWYGGGKLAADLTLPKLRARWGTSSSPDAPLVGHDLPPAAVRGALRTTVTRAAAQTAGEAGFFARLREDGVLVRLRFSEINPGQVTGYSVALPGHLSPVGETIWHGGGRLAAGLSLPQLRLRWNSRSAGQSGRHGMIGFTTMERDAVFDYAARQAADAAERIRRHAASDPAQAADLAHAVAGTLHVAARVMRSQVLQAAADVYDRASRMPYGRVPARTKEGTQLRAAARMLAMTGPSTADNTLAMIALAVKLAALAIAVGDLRQAQQHATQAAAARTAAGHMQTAFTRARSSPARPVSMSASRARPDQQDAVPAIASGACPAPAQPSLAPSRGTAAARPRPQRNSQPPLH